MQKDSKYCMAHLLFLEIIRFSFFKSANFPNILSEVMEILPILAETISCKLKIFLIVLAMAVFFVFILMGLLFYGIIKCLPVIVVIALSPFWAIKEGVELLFHKKTLSETRCLSVYFDLLKAIILFTSVLLFFPVINTYGTFKRGKQTLGTLLIFVCILVYGGIAFVIYLEHFL